MMQQFIAHRFGGSHLGMRRIETHHAMAEPPLNDLLQSAKSAAADKQDAARVDADVFLLRMLTSTLGRNIADSAFKDFQQGLLNAFAGDITRDGNVLSFARDLVDLVDVNDAALCAFYVVIGVLQEAQDNVF